MDEDLNSRRAEARLKAGYNVEVEVAGEPNQILQQSYNPSGSNSHSWQEESAFRVEGSGHDVVSKLKVIISKFAYAHN